MDRIFTNFFTNKNKSYKSVFFNSENSGFIVSKLVVESAEQDTYFSIFLFLTLQTFTKGVSILKFYIKLQGLVHWLVFFCLIQLMERATFRIIINVGQLSLSAQSCVLTKILSGIQQFLKCHFTAYKLDKTKILNESDFICQKINNHTGQNLVKTQLCAVATVFVL